MNTPPGLKLKLALPEAVIRRLYQFYSHFQTGIGDYFLIGSKSTVFWR